MNLAQHLFSTFIGILLCACVIRGAWRYTVPLLLLCGLVSCVLGKLQP